MELSATRGLTLDLGAALSRPTLGSGLLGAGLFACALFLASCDLARDRHRLRRTALRHLAFYRIQLRHDIGLRQKQK